MGKDKKKSKHKHKHDKKKRKRDSPSSSSSDSDSSSESGSVERKRAKAERLAKKLSERLKRSGAVAGYTNECNPFGDTNLTERFVWHKKLEKQIIDGTDVRELGLKAERLRQKERMAEIEKVKKRREDREVEKAQMEEEKEMIERERALADAVELEKKEEEFHLKQARVRAAIRMQEGRPKAIDLLAANLSYFEALAEAAAAPPGTAAAAPPRFDPRVDPAQLTDGLSYAELSELENDVRALAALDRADATHAAFWDAMLRVCADEAERAAGAASDPGLHGSLDADVAQMFAGKTSAELRELEEQIGDTLASGTAPEPEYWEAVLRRLQGALARATVSEIHGALRARVLGSLPGGGGADIRTAMGWDTEAGGPPAGGAGGVSPLPGGASPLPGGWGDDGEEDEELAALAAAPNAEPQDGRYSPVHMACVAREDAGAPVVDAEADAAEMAAARAAVRAREAAALSSAAAAAVRAAGPSGDDAALRAALAAAAPDAGGGGGGGGVLSRVAVTPEEAADEARARELRGLAAKAMGDDEGGAEVVFSGEVALDSQVYWWHDKYRPRKPKYFNRVHTGYEWNKYNQTHYDHDNPPPKVVQGYKFNIFYPDLIDKTKAPSYTIEPDDSKGETCILRFHAGPPYEDIAFKIVNKEWEHSHKRGFKCTFERGILFLYINFVRPRYRR